MCNRLVNSLVQGRREKRQLAKARKRQANKMNEEEIDELNKDAALLKKLKRKKVG